MKVVIQCGGRGTRLRPYTTILPKPLMPVGSRPVLELLLKWLRTNGMKEIYVTTGYLGHLIRTVCGDGRQWDMIINYTEENEPLGTIGPLSLLRERLDGTFLVINGDILTDLSLNAFVTCHRQHNHVLTVATTARTIKTDFGLIDESDGRITSFKEKPVLSHLVSMGIYCMEPSVFDYIPAGVPFGFDNLVLCMLSQDTPVGTFRHNGTWLDVGRIEDFQKAQDLGLDEQPPAFEMIAAA